MADTPFMDEERHAELARQQALWLAQGAPRPALPGDQEITPQQARNEAFSKSPFGAIDRTLKAGTDWIKGRVKKRTAPFEAVQRRDQEVNSGRETIGGTNPLGLPQALPDPVELIPTMLMEGARTANRWLYGTKDTSQLRDEDLLGPLGMSAMAAPFAKGVAHLGSQVRSGLPAAGAEAIKSTRELQAPFTRQVDDLGYYSKLDEVLAGLKPTDTVTMDTLAKRGVKAAEIEARGLTPFVADGKGAKVGDLQKGAQPVQLRESRYGSQDAHHDASLERFGDTYDEQSLTRQRQIDEQLGRPLPKEAKWRDYVTDGDNPTYREGVLHLPGNETSIEAKLAKIDAEAQALKAAGDIGPRYFDLETEAIRLHREASEAYRGNFRSGHWDEPNAIAHYRSSIQPTEGGGKAYLIDELQSDWGQKLRDGGVRDEAKIADLRARLGPLRDEIDVLESEAIKHGPGSEADKRYNALTSEESRLDAELRTAEAATPGNPFVNTSDQWMTTALRRIMRDAAESDAQGIAITPGAVHNERFGLEKQISSLEYNPTTQTLTARPHDGRRGIYEEGVTPEKLEQMVGKETAQKLMAQPASPSKVYQGEVTHVLEGQDLRMGGEGMKYAYDRMLPKLLGKELQRLDPSIKYGQTKLLEHGTTLEHPTYLGIGDDISPFHYFPLTPKAREEIMKGLPMFSNPGTEQILELMRAQQQLQSPFTQDE